MSVVSAIPLGEACSLQPPDLHGFPVHTLKRAHCHSAQVAGPPSADGGEDAQSLLGWMNLLLIGVEST